MGMARRRGAKRPRPREEESSLREADALAVEESRRRDAFRLSSSSFTSCSISSLPPTLSQPSPSSSGIKHTTPPPSSPAPNVLTFPLARLPDDTLAMIASQLSPEEVLSLSCVCSGWFLHSDRTALWDGLAHYWGLQSRQGTGRSLRSTSSHKRSLFSRVRARQRLRKIHADRVFMQLQRSLRFRDAVGHVERALVSKDIEPDHRLFEYGPTLLYVACYHGRTAAASRLVAHGANANICDGLGFNAFHAAAWGGRSAVVDMLFKDSLFHIDLSLEGSPPMTSSCGGTGPYTAEVWAVRKGHKKVLDVIAAYKNGELGVSGSGRGVSSRGKAGEQSC